MIAFDRHTQSMEKEGMARHELICSLFFLSIRLKTCGKNHFSGYMRTFYLGKNYWTLLTT